MFVQPFVGVPVCKRGQSAYVLVSYMDASMEGFLSYDENYERT